MNNRDINTYTLGNLAHIIWISALTGTLISFNEYSINGFSETTLLAMFLSIVALSIAIFARGEIIRVFFVWMLYIDACVVSYIVWVGGGLSDLAIIVYPAIIMLMALIGNLKHTIVIYIVMVLSLILLGVSTVEDLNPNQPEPLNLQKVIGVIILFTLTAYISFAFSINLRKKLTGLALENKKSLGIQHKLKDMAHHDSLTGLYSRAAIDDKYKQLVERVSIEYKDIYLYFIDLDDFKAINDNYNHSIGDQLLKEIANRLRCLTGEGDIVCRLGGDEFLIIIARSMEFSSEGFSKTLLSDITKPYTLFSWELEVTASIGVSVVPQDGFILQDIRKKADLAMYKAKSLGKNTVCHYNEKIGATAERKGKILESLKHAIDNRLLDLRFQPTFDLTDGCLIGARAMVNWQRENPYQADYNEFMPIIENSEIVVELGEWLVREACCCCKSWHEAGYSDIRLAIGISSLQLSRNDFTRVITNALKSSGLPPEYLEIELDEHLLFGQSGRVSSQLEEIKALGVSLAIESFATGYSNLSKLTHLDLDSLKLDKSFTQDFSNSREHLAVVKAILSMAQILGIKSTAEGIENEWQLQLLKALKCDYGQGDLWGPPLSNVEFIKRLEPGHYSDGFKRRDNSAMCAGPISQQPPTIAAPLATW